DADGRHRDGGSTCDRGVQAPAGLSALLDGEAAVRHVGGPIHVLVSTTDRDLPGGAEDRRAVVAYTRGHGASFADDLVPRDTIGTRRPSGALSTVSTWRAGGPGVAL